ncbi:MAG TPA: dihydroorotate dehydrogenase, partial [Smithellaceae bacterium]|nr:dihydroorotate dehydrogenase [Smithellaceae bacterium]
MEMSMVETNNINMSVKIGKLKLKNPVMTASGTFGYGEEYADYVDLNKLGAIVVKGLSLKPRAGNSPPRIMETTGGMLNAVGLQNIGVEAFVAEKLPFLRQFDTKVIANIYGETYDEYKKVAQKL